MNARCLVTGGLLALAVLSGCTLHRPQQVELPVVLPQHYLEQAAGGTVVDRWWKQLGDPELDGLMEEMFARNLELEQGFARLEQARAAVRSVDSARYPFLNAKAQQGRTGQPSFAGDYTGGSRELSLAAGFEIDLWGKLAARTRAASRQAEATREDLETLYLGLTAELADLYYLAVEQRAQLALTENTVSSFADTLERVESRYRRGLVPAVDVYQARQSLAAARAARHVFEANLAAAEHGLAVLLGRYPDRDSAGRLAKLPEMPPISGTGLPAGLVGRRPDLQAALRRVEAADAEVAAAIADRFPTISLSGSFGRSRQEFSTGLIEGEFWSWLGQLTQPVLDGGRRRAEVDRSRAVVRERVAAYQQAVLEAFREVEDALSAYRSGEKRLRRLEETESASGASLRLALERYLNGLTDYLPVLTAQRSHFQARSDLLNAQRQLISSRISLARALGGNWMNDVIEERAMALQGVKQP